MSGPKLIVASLAADGPASTATIIDRLGINARTASITMGRLHDARRVHVSGWEGAQRPVYAAGDGVDKRRPPVVTKAQWNRRQHRQIKADPVKLLEKTMRDRAYKARNSTKQVPPQSWLSALKIIS